MTVITGLMNVHRRLQILYGKECGVSLVRKEMGVDVMIIVRKFLDLDIERRIPENV